jgi:hypothetical protein
VLRCNKFIVTGRRINQEIFDIGDEDSGVIIDENGIKLRDNDGELNDLSMKYMYIGTGDIKQSLSNNNEVKLIFDKDTLQINESYFSVNDNGTDFTILKDGCYFIIYDLSVDNRTGNSTTSMSYIKVNNEIFNNSYSYGYHRQKYKGADTLTSSHIMNLKKNDIIELIIKRTTGKSYLETIPHSSTFVMISVG